MDFFRGLNKEQWTALTTISWSGILLLFGFAGGAPLPEGFPRSGAEEPYVVQRPRYVELPDDKFERYWNGKRIFNIESAVKPPVPPLKAPEPREEEMPIVAFRPGPAWEIYNRLPAPSKYPMLVPNAPAVAEANLPTAAEIGELSKLEEPAAAAHPDQRNQRDREIAIIYFKNKSRVDAVELLGNVGEWITFKDTKGNRGRRPAADVLKIEDNYTKERQIQIESEKLQKYGSGEPEERLKLAQKCVEWGMLPEARAELKRALEVRKDYLDAIVALGQLDVEASNFDGAIATYRAGMDAGAPAGELWFEIGKCLRAISFHDGALQAFEKAVENQPRLHRGRIMLSRELLDTGNAQGAVDAATDFFTKLGNSPDTTPQFRGEAFTARGLALVRLGLLEKAHADFGEAIKIDANNAEALNGNGAAFAAEGQYPQAGPEFVKAIRANQYLTEAWTNLVSLCLLGGKWADAETLAGAAVQRDPSSAEAVLGLALAQLLGGKKEAPQTMTRAGEIDPHNLEVLMVTGLFMLRQGQNEEALERFVSALRQEYFYLPAYSGAAAAYLRTARKLAQEHDDASQKKAAELRIDAATLLQAIRNIDPERPGTWLALGCAYAVMQRPEDARVALRRAKENDPLIFYTRGYIEYYYSEGDEAARLDTAKREFEQGAKIEIPATDAFSQKVIAECKGAIEEIEWWNRTSIQLNEEFNGPDAKNIGGGWISDANQTGLAITRENSKEKGGRGKFSGKQALKDWALTSLLHDIPGDEFFSMEVTFFPEKVDKTEYGLALFHTHQGPVQTGFCVGVDISGKVRFAANTTNRDLDTRDLSVGWTEIKTPVPNPKEITIRVTSGEKGRQRAFTISYWNAQKGEWTVAHKDIPVNPPRGNWRVGAWAHAWRDQDVLLYVDNIKVMNQARR